MPLNITWLGHATFLVETPNGKRLLFDPFLTGQPNCPPGGENVGPVDLMLVTHGHLDHQADAVRIAKETNCPVIGIVELMGCLNKAGAPADNLTEMNKGGSVRFEDLGLTVTMTHALHSSGFETGTTAPGEAVYAGEPAGFVVTLDDGFAFYFAGDTAVFGDMALISELYAPKLAFLPIGDHYTMGPKQAAKACELLSSVETVIPMHYGTFPALTGTPEAFAQALKDRGLKTAVRVLKPGQPEEV
jgi:L-ascorbate metabolism protein UlaG (beta-lactamase superfamily)